ncbi:B-cell scaffold protein with ankyrin repeats-like isoform X2 [Betta splendens]|uniref:B-cell scaffold protein with ankyrin repeats-like isoform X2 n=1 Tax=Betta splendens TaxID=158456 RepID=A0A8M1HLZ2_BETSP|nr:B-cell scaffold protein with ankyrin repeats-like isoform X2 [Betta splendens]
MSQSAKQLLIIYEAEAEQWASYLRSVFTGPIPASGICCYDITGGSGRDEPVLRPFACKLVILSKGLVEALSQRLRALLARVLSPAAGVVVLLCGVDSLTPLLELVPLDANECLQVSSEQDANEYLSAVTDVVRKGVGSPSADLNPVACGGSGSVLVVPSRVLCGSCVEVFVLLKNRAVGGDAQLEFSGGNHTLSVTPARWNERTLRVSAPDFAAGRVTVTVLSDGAALGSAALQYCSSTEELGHILSRLMDPVQLMCEALQVSSVEKLDQRLASMLLEAMPGEGVQGLRWPEQPQTELQREDLPSLLHFAAQFGLRRVARLLLQVPGAARALHAADRRGRTPAEVAREHGHAQLHALLKETPKVSNVSEDRSDAGVYEIMCTADVQKEQRGEEEEEEEQEELYTPLGGDDEYDTIVKAVDIANRPPAPTPRPESTALQDRTPFIAQERTRERTEEDSEVSIY